jgi:hypothetical protein
MDNKNKKNSIKDNIKINMQNKSQSQTPFQMKNVINDIFKNNKEGFKHVRQNIFLGAFAIANVFIIFPYMKKIYLKLYSNQAEITHIVNKIMIKIINLFF